MKKQDIKNTSSLQLLTHIPNVTDSPAIETFLAPNAAPIVCGRVDNVYTWQLVTAIPTTPKADPPPQH